MTRVLKIPFRNGRKVCIFCGSTPVTKEHVWPVWAAPLMPTGSGHRRYLFSGKVRQPAKLEKSYQRQGGVHTIRIRRVCGACNSGWMGTYEEEVRPLLSQMMLGERTVLTNEARRKLAGYFTYKFLVMDWAEDDPVMPPEAAHAFFADRTIPPKTRILILNCFEGPWRSAQRTHAFAMCKQEDYSGPNMPRNTKSFAIGFGNLFVLAFFSTQVEIDFEIGPACVTWLWPVQGGGSVSLWPPQFPIDSGRADFLARTIERFQFDPRVRVAE